METTKTSRMESRSKDFAAFMQTANIGNDSRDYLMLVGKLENWSRECVSIITRDYNEKTAGEIIEDIDNDVLLLERRIMNLFSDKVFDKAMDIDSDTL